MKRKKIIKKLEELGFEMDGMDYIFIGGEPVTVGTGNCQQPLSVEDVESILKINKVIFK